MWGDNGSATGQARGGARAVQLTARQSSMSGLPVVVRALVFLAILHAAPLYAQTAETQRTDPDPSVGAMFRNGTLAWTPALVFSFGHDTNVYREAIGFGDYETFTVPQMEAWWVQPGFAVRMVGAFEAVRFGGHVGGNNNQVGIGFKRRQSIIRPYLNYNRRRTNANPTGFEVGYKSLRVENDFSGGVRAVVSPRSEFSFVGRLTRTRWDADAIYQTSDLREKLNRDTRLVGAGYSYAVTPLTSVGGRVEIAHDRFQFSPLRDGDTVRLWSQVDFAKPAVIFGSAAIGHERFSSSASGAADFNGLVATASIGYGTPDGTLIKVLVNRESEYSFDTSLAYYVMTSENVTVSRRVGRVWDLAGFVNRYMLDYRPAGLQRSADRSDTVFEYGAAVARRAGRWARIGVTVEHAEKRAADPFESLRVVGFLTYGSGRFQRLDRPTPFER